MAAAASLTTRRALKPARAGGCGLAVVALALALALAALALPPRQLVGASAVPADGGGPEDWYTVSVSSLAPSTVCKAAKGTSDSSALTVVHRHGPCSPLRPRGSAPWSHAEALDRDRDRVNAIRRGTADATKGTSVPARWATALGTYNYVVTVGLGTPPRNFTMEVDSGSDLSWVQCAKCARCYGQQDPLFDPAESSTFSTVPCGAPECLEVDERSCAPGKDRCPYEVEYADGSRTRGDLARDTLTLTTAAPSGSGGGTIPGFVFGCGHRNSGQFGREDGLIGLARGAVSLSSQAAGRYGAGFSYCLPSSPSATGYLALGLRGAPANAQFTAMLTDDAMPSQYYLRLAGIKVAGEAVRIPPEVFGKAAPTMIDSGTQITFLPDTAFAALRSAFVRRMGGYRRAPGLSFLDACYNFTGLATVRIPSVALVFAGGATVALDASGVMAPYGSDEPHAACLAFASTGDDTSSGFLGSTQQKTLAVVYDVANRRIGFGAKGCA